MKRPLHSIFFLSLPLPYIEYMTQSSNQDCGTIVYFDVPLLPSASARALLVLPTEPSTLAAEPIHPVSNPPAASQQSSTRPGSTSQPDQCFDQANQIPMTDRNPLTPDTSSGSRGQDRSALVEKQLIYWCVGTGGSRPPHAMKLDVCNLTDQNLATTLSHGYWYVSGWWYRFWTMSTCKSVSFNKVGCSPVGWPSLTSVR